MMHFADCVSREHVTDICRRCCRTSVSGRTRRSSRYFCRWKINVHYSKTSKVKQKSRYTKSSMDHWFSKYFVSSLVELLCCLRKIKSLTCSWVFGGSVTSCTKQESIPEDAYRPFAPTIDASIATRYHRVRELVSTGLQWWPTDVTSRGFLYCEVPCPEGSPYSEVPCTGGGPCTVRSNR